MHKQTTTKSTKPKLSPVSMKVGGKELRIDRQVVKWEPDTIIFTNYAFILSALAPQAVKKLKLHVSS